jgi:hypothetical protein
METQLCDHEIAEIYGIEASVIFIPLSPFNTTFAPQRAILGRVHWDLYDFEIEVFDWTEDRRAAIS